MWWVGSQTPRSARKRHSVVTFLFWNINRKPLQSEVANLALSHNADLVILAECHVPTPTMLASLNARGGPVPACGQPL